MAEKYKPLRVPIALLHQRAFSTARRLDKWMPLVEADLKEKPLVSKIFGNGRAATPFGPIVVQGKYDVMYNVFDRTHYLRKYWRLIDGVQRTACRGCGHIVNSDQERQDHYGCNIDINRVVYALVDDGICSICEKPTFRTKVNIEYHGCPVCDDACLAIWDVMNPPGFEIYWEKQQKDGKIRD